MFRWLIKNYRIIICVIAIITSLFITGGWIRSLAFSAVLFGGFIGETGEVLSSKILNGKKLSLDESNKKGRIVVFQIMGIMIVILGIYLAHNYNSALAQKISSILTFD